MQAKGLDPSVLDKDPMTPVSGGVAAAGGAVAGGAAAASSGGEGQVLWKDDPDYGPFFKMLKMKVPRGAVELKVQAKGLDPSGVDCAKRAGGIVRMKPALPWGVFWPR